MTACHSVICGGLGMVGRIAQLVEQRTENPNTVFCIFSSYLLFGVFPLSHKPIVTAIASVKGCSTLFKTLFYSLKQGSGIQ
jgi:hypothetical protein